MKRVLLICLFLVASVRAADKSFPPEFVQKWHDTGEFGKEIGCVVRVASNLEKVGLDDTTSGTIVAANPTPVRISAARNEHEGFQIVLSPMPGCAKHVSISDLNLFGPGMGGQTAIPASFATVNAVGYVRIFAGKPTEKIVPDPLLIGEVPELTPGENQPIWIDLYVPPRTPPGMYHGSVRVNELQIPIELHVRNFDIPKKISLRSSFWLFRDQINRFYHLKEVSIDDYLKWVDFALAHRVCPVDVYEGSCDQLLDIIQSPTAKDPLVGDVNPHPDFTNWDKFIDHMVAGGASTIHLGMSHHFGAFFVDDQHKVASPGQIERVKKAVKILEDHYKAKGVFDLEYLQLRDETSEPDSLNVYREIHAAFPEIKLLLTVPSPQARPFVNIPCPQTPGFDPAWRDEAKRNGGEYWWYVCLSPHDPYANLFIFQTGAQHRALFWQTWSHNVDGLLYWGLNYWSDYKATWPADAHSQVTRLPPPDNMHVGALAQYPGDGFSIYPGPDPATPMSSIRLESIRDGEEDYEYFVLLDQLIAKAPAGAVVDEAKKVRDDARKQVENMTGYDKTAAPYAAIRERVGDAIEALLAPK